jgi:antimicrobial peptide system SdpB family protein
MARLQVAVLYLHAATGKFSVPEWVNGTALYYWLLEPAIGITQKHHDVVLWLLRPAWVTPLISWAPLALELALFCAIGMSSENRMRRVLFAVAALFHVGNFLFFGLFSFMLTMFAALVLLLRPASRPYRLYAFGGASGVHFAGDKDRLSSLVATGLSEPTRSDCQEGYNA